MLAAALRAKVPYVGLVASRKRGEAVVASLDLCPSMKGCGPHPRRPRSRRSHTAGDRTVDPGRDRQRHVPGRVGVHWAAATVPLVTRPPASRRRRQEATDPVCGMTVAMVESSLHLDHEGERIWFCGSGCLRAFAADPSAYATP